MKRFGVLLALLVLFATLSGTVWADSYLGRVQTPNPMVGTGALLVDFIIKKGNEYYVAYLDDAEDAFTIQLSDGRTITEADFTKIAETYVVDGLYWRILKYNGDSLTDGTLTSFGGTSVSVTMNVINVRDFGILALGDNELNAVIGDKVWVYGTHILDGSLTADTNGYNINSYTVTQDQEFYRHYIELSSHILNITSQSTLTWTGFVLIEPFGAIVTLSIKDALSGQPLTGVTVKENGTVLGTLDDSGTLELDRGTHTLTFEKDGYWSITKTIDVQSDMNGSVEMYPSSAAFKLENFPADISIPENTIYTLTFTLSPIQTSATYNTYLSLSGLSDIIEVRKDGSVISPESGMYYLGDISGPTQVSIKFKAGAVGTHGFTLTLTSNDAIMSKTYTTTKQVTYQAEPLLFSVQMPSEWQVGTNELRISESSGQSYLITAVLKDSQGNEVWSDSHAFSPYEAHTFQVKIPSEGSYTLELQWNGQTAVYSVQVNPAIMLKTKTLTVQKGGEGTIVLHFKNPSSDVQYYTIKVSGGFLPKEINQSISIAPLTEKDVSIAFAVPDNLQYDAYELNVAVMQGNATVFSDKVAVSISDSSGFSLLGGASSSKTLYYSLAALVGLGLFVAILRRR